MMNIDMCQTHSVEECHSLSDSTDVNAQRKEKIGSPKHNIAHNYWKRATPTRMADMERGKLHSH